MTKLVARVRSSLPDNPIEVKVKVPSHLITELLESLQKDQIGLVPTKEFDPESVVLDLKVRDKILISTEELDPDDSDSALNRGEVGGIGQWKIVENGKKLEEEKAREPEKSEEDGGEDKPTIVSSRASLDAIFF